ncbi:hypothetical protein NQ318_004700 [Aromia moschata]|uniref:Uncharacterized protein n=1 Tax=Aromia moschata TaxID=1265417 RepID=A0AAV8XH63_9CUCU|nr:hypothetical protein NQ318_004700 [Aromia moschata]
MYDSLLTWHVKTAVLQHAAIDKHRARLTKLVCIVAMVNLCNHLKRRPYAIVRRNQNGQSCLALFFDHLNILQINIEFTMETEQDGALLFMDVLVKRTHNKVAHGAYRKKSHTSCYLNAEHHNTIHNRRNHYSKR